MKLKSRARRATNTAKRENSSIPTHLSSEEAIGLVPDATLSVKQDSESFTLVKQKEPFASSLTSSNMQVESNEETDKAIKQEEASKAKIALELYKNDKIYYYQCRLCLQIQDSFQSLREHREIVHKIKEKTSSIKHMHLEPDVHDPNHFCQSCEETFSTKWEYRQHLNVCHHIALKLGPKSNVVPDPDNPNLYCCSCQRTYKHWATYKKHLITIHAMKVRPRLPQKNPANPPDLYDPKFYCAQCEKKLSCESVYKTHLRNVYKWVFFNADAIIDECEPDNYYCEQCQKHMSSREAFRQHLYNVHHISLL